MGRHAANPRRRGVPVLTVAVVAVASLIVGGTLAANFFDRGTTATATPKHDGNCPIVKVATTADFLPALRTVVEQMVARGECAHYELADTRGSDVIAADIAPGALRSGLTGTNVSIPNVWIPDSLVGLESMRRAVQSSGSGVALERGEEVATSPVVLAVPASLASRDTTDLQPWPILLTRLPLSSAPAPTNTAATLSFISWWQRLGTDSATQQAMSGAFLQMVRSSQPTAELVKGAASPDPKAFAASEQQIAAANQQGAGLKAATPQGDLPQLHYTVVKVGSPASGLRAAVDRLEAALTSASGKQVLSAAGFRVPGGSAPGVDGIPPALDDGEAAVSVGDFDRMHRTWGTISRALRITTVVDVSGSMAARAGGNTRIALAGAAVQQTVQRLKPTDELGLWTFSTAARAGEKPWQIVQPVAAVGRSEDAASHAARLIAATKALPRQLRGDTSLYDTILAAVEQARAGDQPDKESLVVVITDGRNDDPRGGLTEAGLEQRLGAGRSIEHPVRLVLIGMGRGADMAAMQRITAAVGGRAYLAEQPQDVVSIMARAVWQVEGVR